MHCLTTKLIGAFHFDINEGTRIGMLMKNKKKYHTLLGKRNLLKKIRLI